MIFAVKFLLFVVSSGIVYSNWGRRHPVALAIAALISALSFALIVENLWNRQQNSNSLTESTTEKVPRNTPNFPLEFTQSTTASNFKPYPISSSPLSNKFFDILTSEKPISNSEFVYMKAQILASGCGNSSIGRPRSDPRFFNSIVVCLAQYPGYFQDLNHEFMDIYASNVEPYGYGKTRDTWAEPYLFMLLAISDNKIESRDIARMKLVMSSNPFNGQRKGSLYNGSTNGEANDAFAKSIYRLFIENGTNATFSISPSFKRFVQAATDKALANKTFRMDRYGPTHHSGMFEIYGEVTARHGMGKYEDKRWDEMVEGLRRNDERNRRNREKYD